MSGCSGHYNQNAGEQVCCGQNGKILDTTDVCPIDKPICVGYELNPHVKKGTCMAQSEIGVVQSINAQLIKDAEAILGFGLRNKTQTTDTHGHLNAVDHAHKQHNTDNQKEKDEKEKHRKESEERAKIEKEHEMRRQKDKARDIEKERVKKI